MWRTVARDLSLANAEREAPLVPVRDRYTWQIRESALDGQRLRLARQACFRSALRPPMGRLPLGLLPLAPVRRRRAVVRGADGLDAVAGLFAGTKTPEQVAQAIEDGAKQVFGK